MQSLEDLRERGWLARDRVDAQKLARGVLDSAALRLYELVMELLGRVGNHAAR
jgi:hypothetical protein